MISFSTLPNSILFGIDRCQVLLQPSKTTNVVDELEVRFRNDAFAQQSSAGELTQREINP